MITRISIENFKGIRERVEIEVRPLTLLFGANSAGKSSILHAVNYAAEIFERRNLNAAVIGDGAAGVDLGGYQNFVHGHNWNLDVALGFGMEFPLPSPFPSFSTRTPRDVDDPSSLYGLPKSANVSVAIGWSNLLSAPFVRRYAVALDEVDLAEIRSEPGRPDCTLDLNELHPTFQSNNEHSALALWHPLDADELLDLAQGTVISHLAAWATHTRAIVGIGPSEMPFTACYGLVGQKDALPDFDRPLSLDADWDWVDRDSGNQGARLPELSDYLTEAISQVVLGPGRILRDLLVQSRFLGPIREVPQRHHTPSRQQERSRWGSGLGAWDRLEAATADDEGRKLIDCVSHWLGEDDALKSGYRLRLKRFKELDLDDPLLVQLATGRAFDDVDVGARLDLNSLPTETRVLIVPVDGSIELRPHDVGIGISQVVPVIVTALDGEGRLLAIEQPELHMHPRLQAAVADLFVEAIDQKKQRFLIETHSEHLILRVLRRIRETETGKAPLNRQLRTDALVIYYLKQDDGSCKALRIDVDVNGEFIQPWPDDFFEIDFYERFA